MRKKWFLFFILYLGGVTISLSQLKITPIQGELHSILGFSYTQISWLMSIFTFTGIFLALPGGILVAKIGRKKLLLYLMTFTAMGNLIGFLSDNYWVLFFSRIIEGVAFSMIIMLGIVYINDWFKDGHKGLFTGIWSTFSAFGSLIAMNLFLPLTKEFGLKIPWLIIMIISIFLFVLFFIFIPKDTPLVIKNKQENRLLVKRTIRIKPIIWLALAQGCMAFILFSFINLYPMLYKEAYHLNLMTANRLTSYFGLFGIPFGAIAGYLIDKTKKGTFIAGTSFIIMFLGIVYLFKVNSYFSFIIQSFILSSGASLASSSIMTIAPEYIKDKTLVGTGISIINLVYYVAIVISTPIISSTVNKSGNWTMGLYIFAFISLFGAFCMYISNKKNSKEVLS